MAASPSCPRCRSATTSVRSKSATAGIWTVFGCDTCFYAWRSTEPAENVDPEQYPPLFRLKPDEIDGLPIVPTVPPLRAT